MKERSSLFKSLTPVITFILACLWAVPAFAVQAHGGSEGLVSHQVGHILFISGMIYMLYRVYHNHITGPGWFEFKGFLWLIISWNILTFTGHLMREFVNPDRFMKDGVHIISFAITDLFDAVFYLTRLDHLLLVPSFLFLVVALQKWKRTT
jgi:hypothetical protein